MGRHHATRLMHAKRVFSVAASRWRRTHAAVGGVCVAHSVGLIGLVGLVGLVGLIGLLASCRAGDRLPWPSGEFPPSPVVDAAQAALGRQLFYDPVISSDNQTACATCHSEIWGMSDGLPVSIGRDAGLLAGPSRTGTHVGRRNAPALWNVAFRGSFNLDGRAASLETQAELPLHNLDELNLPPVEAVAKLNAIDAYRALFADAFDDATTDDPVTTSRLTKVLAEFQRKFVSNNSIYDAYADGDDHALTEAMVAGMFRFEQFGCPSCHTPPMFDSSRFEARGIGDTSTAFDLGRFEVTRIEADRYAFRVPTLRNFASSAPYFHNGSVATPQEAVRHELTRSGLPFDDDDVVAITEFLEGALQDTSKKPVRPTAVPSGLPVPLDGTELQH